MKVDWQTIKDFVDSRGLRIEWIDYKGVYFLSVRDDYFQLEATVDKTSADGIEFENDYKTVHGNGSLITLIDTVNSQLSYKCEALKNVATSEAKWKISRTTKSGNIIKTEYANNGAFVSVCDDRATYFGPVVFDNVYSTFFDGINDTINFGDNYGFDRNIAFSFGLWIKPQNISQTRYFINKMTADASAIGWRMGHDSAGKIIFQARTSGQAFAPITFNSTIVAQDWNRILFAFDGSSNQTGYKVYFNGVLDSYSVPSQALAGSWVNSAPLILGAGTASAFHYVGGIDQFAIYNREISAAEELAIYQAGASQRLSEMPSSGSAVLSEWDLGDNDIYPTIEDKKDSINGTMLSMSVNSFQQDVP